MESVTQLTPEGFRSLLEECGTLYTNLHNEQVEKQREEFDSLILSLLNEHREHINGIWHTRTFKFSEISFSHSLDCILPETRAHAEELGISLVVTDRVSGHDIAQISGEFSY